MMPKIQQKLHVFWQSPRPALLLMTLAGFWLRLYRLGDKAVWWDEGLAAWAARQSLAAMSAWTANDVHPPLYFWLLHFWRMASGDSEFGLRLLSALIGVLTIPATYLLGSAVGGKKVGLLAALLLTISRFNIAWSQEMRMYALASLLAALALWAAVRVWNRGRRRDWALYVLFMTAGLYTLYLSVMVLVVVNLVWLLLVLPRARRRGREFITWSLGQAAVLLLFAPWMAYAIGRIPTWTSASPVAFGDFLQIYWTVLVVGIPLNVGDYARLTLPVLAIFGAGTAVLLWQARHRPRQGRDLALLLVGLLLPALIVYLVSLPKTSFFYAPQIAPRYLIIFLAGYTVLLAWSIVQWNNGRFGRILAALFALLTILATLAGLRDYYPGRVLLDDYKSLARTLTVYAQPQDAVVLNTDTDWPIWAYHYPGDWHGVPHAWQISPQQAEDYLAPIWEEHDGVWLVVTPYAGISDPAGHLTGWLAERATAVSTTSYGDKALHFYARTPQRAAAMESLAPAARPQFSQTAALAAGATLAGYDQAARDYRSGDEVHLALYFETEGEFADAEVGIMNSSGVAQVWEHAAVPEGAGGLVRQEYSFTLPPDTPTGDYAFYLLDGKKANVTLGNLRVQQRFGTALQLGEVTIPQRLETDFSNNISLLGYGVETENPQPGGTVFLTLYWQARGTVPQRYKVFTHLLGDVFNAETENFLWGQQDNEPVNLSRPTTSWRTGEVIVDRYAIPIAANAPDGEYLIEIGLYEPATGVRLPVQTGAGETAAADHLILTTITIASD